MKWQQVGLLDWGDTHLHRAMDAAGVAFWSWNVDTDCLKLDALAHDLWDVPAKAFVTFEELSSRIHPSDLNRVRTAFKASRAASGSYEIDFRIVVGNKVRWVSTRGRGREEGMTGRTTFGIFLDVTGRKQAEESNELLAGEMSHRVKNLLAIASSLTRITSRSCETAEDMAQQLIHRLSALGCAHELVRPAPGASGGALLEEMLSVLLAPYDDFGEFAGRISVSVPRLEIGEASTTTLALIIHELATNSIKYGALSLPAGRLDITASSVNGAITIVWAESGGPVVSAPTGKGGFGSNLINRAISVQLGGSIACDWAPKGLVVTLNIKQTCLAM